MPDTIINSYVSLISPKNGDNPLVYKVAYSSDLSIFSINGKQPKFTIELTLVNSHGQESLHSLEFKLACTIPLSDFEAVTGVLEKEIVGVEAEAEKDISMNATYTEIYDKLVQTLKYDEQKKKGCGEIKFELITLQNFLTHDATKKMVILKSDKETFKGTFLDSHLQIKLLHYTWLLPVNATFVECKLTSLGFKSSYGSIAYRLGSGKMKSKLPEIK